MGPGLRRDLIIGTKSMTVEPLAASTSETAKLRETGEPLLQTENLTIRLGGLTALDNVNVALVSGRARAPDPPLRRRDEATGGMSAAETRETVALVRRIAEHLTILIVEHDMEVVMGLANRITVLHYGRVLAEGTPAEIQQNPRVLEVYLKT